MTIEIHQNIFFRTHRVAKAAPSLWFIHGFGDSGLVWREAFASPLAQKYNLFAADMPGFGVSPFDVNCTTLDAQAHKLAQIIKATCGAAPVAIVAHSIGGLIGTLICQQLGNQVMAYISAEGNLTKADSYFSGKVLQYESAEVFYTEFKQEVFAKAQDSEAYRRYYSSLNFAQPEALAGWGVSSQHLIKDNACGNAFVALSCPKVYAWGQQGTPQETQQFIAQANVPNHQFANAGHWHMVERPALFYDFVAKVLGNHTKYG